MNPDDRFEQMQMRIKSLESEVQTLREFVKSLYTLIASEEGYEDDISDRFGRFNT